MFCRADSLVPQSGVLGPFVPALMITKVPGYDAGQLAHLSRIRGWSEIGIFVHLLPMFMST